MTTNHKDNMRSAVYRSETVLTPANVNVTNFGKVNFFAVDGKVDAQPLYLANVSIPGGGTHNVLYVVTEHGSAYAFDADSGAQLWKVTTLGAGESPSDDVGCSNLTPEIGITGTPVIDRTRGPNGALYLVAMSKLPGPPGASATYFQRVHALDVATGAELFGGPQTVVASADGTGSGGTTVDFQPFRYMHRTGLLLVNGVLYTTWSSHCDQIPYWGWVIGYSATSLAQTSVLNITPNGSHGAFWMSGSGPAADSA
ncbi:MAG TPA: pyrrolo-quinoline quinone, partial [Burkholderiaceae bacterium]|nr:pyrrolo-quinoline quinone [Burkholderiaceae bacterium]